jgi:hypothetical protein
VSFEDLKREGAADAVLRIVAAKTLLNPHVEASEVVAAAGLTRRDLEAALQRFRAAGRPRPPRPATTPLDDLVMEAIEAHGGSARPRQLKLWMLDHGHEYTTAGLGDSLARLSAVGRLDHPSHGTYCLPGEQHTRVEERKGRTRLVLSERAQQQVESIEQHRRDAAAARAAEA